MKVTYFLLMNIALLSMHFAPIHSGNTFSFIGYAPPYSGWLNLRHLGLDSIWIKGGTVDLQGKNIKDEQHLDTVVTMLIELEKRLGCSITTINLNNNHLRKLPDSIQHLSYLTRISLASNQFSDVPEALLLLSKLQVLDMSSNQITSITSEINCLPFLRYVSFQNNKIVTLPPTIRDLENLSFINLSSNSFSTFPQMLCELNNDCLLKINDNPGNFTLDSPEKGQEHSLLKYKAKYKDETREFIILPPEQKRHQK